MAYPKRQHWPHTLADASGIWCAVCYGPILSGATDPREQLASHHVVAKAVLERMFAQKPSLADAWRVPVHQKCHQSADDQARSSARALRLKCGCNRAATLAWAKEQHDLSDYSRSLLAKLYVLKTFRANMAPDEIAQIEEHCVSSASGVAWLGGCEGLVSDVVPLRDRPGTLLNLSNYGASFGDGTTAGSRLYEADQSLARLPKGRRKDYLGSWLRRLSQLLQDAAAAERAVREETIPYGKITGKILRAEIPAIHGDDWPAREAIAEYWHGVHRPLLYDAVAFYLEAVATLRESKPNISLAYRACVRSQYIKSMLGLNTRLPFAADPRAVIHPDQTAGHLLCGDDRFQRSLEELLEWRREAIGDIWDETSVCYRVNRVLDRNDRLPA